MSTTSENYRKAANYLDAAGIKDFAHSVDLLRSFAARIETLEARATIDAKEFVGGQIQIGQISLKLESGIGPTYTQE